MKGDKAPVALFVYNRPDHTAQTIAALQANHMAGDTDLYVFCDGPKSSADFEAVKQVRELARNIRGFKSVSLVERPDNIGLGQSIISGVSQILETHENVIVFEDDLVSHPETISYFNTLLAHFESHHGVFSISGFNYPASLVEMPDDYEFDIYCIPRMQCWGWATWRDRWQKADWQVRDFEQFNLSPSQTTAYSHWIGRNSLNTLRACMAGQKDVWACRWLYTHFKHHAVCVCPTRSYIDNIGLDGSGVHCGPDDRMKNDLLPEQRTLKLPSTAFVEPRIFERFMRIADPNTPR